MTLDEVMRLIKQSKNEPPRQMSAVAERGVAFELDEKTQKKLRKAGADDDLLAAIWKVTPEWQGPHASALDHSKRRWRYRLRLRKQWLCRRSKTKKRLTGALNWSMHSRRNSRKVHSFLMFTPKRQEPNNRKAISLKPSNIAARAWKLDPDNTFSLIIMALVLPQPKLLKGTPTEVQAQLSEAVTDANRALALLEKLQKRPDETDEQFVARKGSLAADAHFALGMEEMQRNQFDKAVTDYQAAISSTSKPTFQYYYRLAEAFASEGRVPDAIAALQKASELARGTPMQKIADDFMAELQGKTN